ncbi:hypothetical protein K402DRAFT_393312 [Aulographum hederae CBS 113979]|uniref:Uncharacterized protein n=1 Tax=Aulographum hederae CBS 113979 TaxID=1176131 RepID=A0A6G1H268_9PEZI|nr:hypothetical protein K402DRAFT_393312 [Aulographum hederae CBS 113979]
MERFQSFGERAWFEWLGRKGSCGKERITEVVVSKSFSSESFISESFIETKSSVNVYDNFVLT